MLIVKLFPVESFLYFYSVQIKISKSYENKQAMQVKQSPVKEKGCVSDELE